MSFFELEGLTVLFNSRTRCGEFYSTYGRKTTGYVGKPVCLPYLERNRDFVFSK